MTRRKLMMLRNKCWGTADSSRNLKHLRLVLGLSRPTMTTRLSLLLRSAWHPPVFLSGFRMFGAWTCNVCPIKYKIWRNSRNSSRSLINKRAEFSDCGVKMENYSNPASLEVWLSCKLRYIFSRALKEANPSLRARSVHWGLSTAQQAQSGSGECLSWGSHKKASTCSKNFRKLVTDHAAQSKDVG